MRKNYRVDHYTIVAPWEKQPLSRAQCAERASVFLRSIAEVDERLVKLCTLGKSISKPVGSPISVEPKYIEQILRIHEGEPDLGYTLYVIHPDGAFKIIIEDGVYTDAELLVNEIMVEFYPHDNPMLFEFLRVDVLTKIVAAIKDVYNTPYVCVVSDSHYFDMCGVKGISPFVSWMLYLRKRMELLPALPKEVEVKEFGSDGTLIITAQEPFTIDKEDHVLIAGETNRRLEDVGMLAEFNPYRKSSGGYS